MPAVSEARNTRRRLPIAERRKLAIDTHIDLILEGHLPPTIEQVAERSGISAATLFRYFESLDELRNESTARTLERFGHLFAVPEIGIGSRDERIRRFAGIRVKLWETTHFIARLLRSNALKDSGAAELVAFARKGMARQVRVHFATELRELSAARREDAVATIASLTSVESWDQFRHAHDRSPAQTQEAWCRVIDQILSTPPRSTERTKD